MISARHQRPRGRALMWLLLMLAAVAPAYGGALETFTGGGTGPFVLSDIKGQKHDLSAYRGNVVLINFWATWCEPCRLEMPSIQRLQEKLAGKAFTAFAVNVDEPEARVRAFVKQSGFDLQVLLDPDKTVTRKWGVRVLPVTFILDKQGRVRYRAVGDLDWSDDKIVGIISQLLGGA